MKIGRTSLRAALSAAILMIGLSGGYAFGQTTTPDQNSPEPKTEQAAVAQPASVPQTNQPLIQKLENITIGMPYDEVKHILGKPDVEDASGAYFTQSKTHSIQIGLDKKKTVRTIASLFTDGDKQAPSIAEILGNDEATTENGDAYKIIHYEDAGFWIAYSRTNSKDKPVTVVTMRRIE